MRGNNELHLNAATVIEALQEYLQFRYTKPIKVTSIKMESKGYTGDTFIVSVAESQITEDAEPEP